MDLVVCNDKNINNIVYELLDTIYKYKMSGIYYKFNRIYVNKNNVYIGSILSTSDFNNIKVMIIELTFLKCIKISKKWSVLKQNCYFPCSKCGKINTQHKYKCCGNYICVLCAFHDVCKNNTCSQCNKSIFKKKIKLEKDKKKEVCCVCLEECNTKLKNCGHFMHKSCIKECLKKKNSCPMCRRNIINISNKTKQLTNKEFNLDETRSGFTDILIKTI